MAGLNKLTARGVSCQTKRGRYADGGGLYLQVDGKGAKQWTFRYQIEGRRSEMGIGGLDAVPLAKARELAAHARAVIAAGHNPLEQRRASQEAERAAHAANKDMGGRTFNAVMTMLLAAKDAGWRNTKHRAQWPSTLKAYAASLMTMDVADIKTEHVMMCLQPIWSVTPETASRVRGRIEAVLNAAKARGLTPDDRANPARWRGHLDHLLPKRMTLSRGHHAAMPWRDLPGFIAKLREREAVSARALEFIILTAARSGEARGARWDEIDFDTSVWTIPADRMKASREHRVPLSRSALAILEAMRPAAPSAFIFQNDKGAALSDMVFKALFTRLGVGGITTHGFRSAFRDWSGDATAFAREDIEAALAHRLKDKAEAAYRRGDSLEKRRAIMEAWANHCEPRTGNVVTLPRAG